MWIHRIGEANKLSCTVDIVAKRTSKSNGHENMFHIRVRGSWDCFGI